MNLHIFILGSLAQYLPVGQMGSSGTFLPNFLASKIILSCSSPRPACDLVGDAVPASAALPAGQQEGGHKFTPPKKIASPTHPSGLNALRAHFGERDPYFALSKTLMQCLLCVEAASIILEEQSSDVLGRNQTSALTTRTRAEVIHQHHTVAATLKRGDLGVCEK